MGTKQLSRFLVYQSPDFQHLRGGRGPQAFTDLTGDRPHVPPGSTPVPIKQKIQSFCRVNRAQGLDLAGQHYRRKLQANFVWNSDLKFHSANKTQRQIKSIVPADQGGGGHLGNSQEFNIKES